MVKFLKKLIEVGCLFAGFAWGQNTGQNVVSLITTPLTTITGTTTYISPIGSNVSLQNIGQTNHTVVINVTAATTTGSNNINIACGMQASIDGSNWASIGVASNYVFSQTQGVPNNYLCNGYGAYPYIRSNVVLTFVGSPSSITFSIGYQGSSIPANSLTDISGVLNDMQFTQVAALTGGAVLTTLISGSVGQSVVVYGIGIYSDATSSDLEFICVAPSGNSIMFRAFELGVQRVQIYPLSFRPYFACPQGGGLSYVLSGTPVTSLGVQFRQE